MQIITDALIIGVNNQNRMTTPLLDETRKLLEVAHEYFTYYASDDQRKLSSDLRRAFSDEMTRVTIRLSSVMSWLMVRNSIIGGEIEYSPEIDTLHLAGREICLTRDPAHEKYMPRFMAYLIEASYRLYERIDYLDSIKHASENVDYDNSVIQIVYNKDRVIN